MVWRDLGSFTLGNFDIVITDIRMPLMSGIEMAYKIRENDQHVEIIFLTSYDEFEYAKKAIEIRAGGYILKPFQDDELDRVIKNAVQNLKNKNKDSEFRSNPVENQSEEQEQNRRIIREVNQYINNNIGKKISLKEVADFLGYSPNHLGQLYKKGMGLFFHEYVIKVKMEKAAMLLKIPQYQISTVAESLGYNEVGYFIKQFKEYYGVTPKVYQSN